MIRLVLWPFPTLDLADDEVINKDAEEYVLRIRTIDGRRFDFIFRKRITYGDIAEYSLYTIIDLNSQKSRDKKQ